MAGDWIKMRVSLWTHPKVVTLSSRLSVTRAHIVGALQCAWCIADQHADENGVVEMGGGALDSLCETPGLSDALVSVGWLSINGQSLQFLNYQEHNGTTGKQRASASKRQKLSRSCHAPVTHKRDTSVTREEKRREEKKKIGNATFRPPTLEEVRAYCAERRNSVIPEKWLDYYTSNGWKVGKNSMKDWRAAIRTWERNGFNSAPSNGIPDRGFQAPVYLPNAPPMFGPEPEGGA